MSRRSSAYCNQPRDRRPGPAEATHALQLHHKRCHCKVVNYLKQHKNEHLMRRHSSGGTSSAWSGCAIRRREDIDGKDFNQHAGHVSALVFPRRI
eukprot:215197-Pleurochrysis_carterae.AAC.1